MCINIYVYYIKYSVHMDRVSVYINSGYLVYIDKVQDLSWLKFSKETQRKIHNTQVVSFMYFHR